LPQRVEQLRQAYPHAEIAVWAFDEHRLGLKPILRKVWAKRGQRPIAVVHHRYQWLYLYAFVCPGSGQTEWLIIPSVNVPWFNQALQVFADAVGAGANKQVLLVLDRAGWHRAEHVVVPEGIHLEFLPPYSPELQPAEHLWQLSDEPLVNRTFEDLDSLEEALATRCLTLSAMPEVIRQHTLFHWWKGL
jgi:hypothetical protein